MMKKTYEEFIKDGDGLYARASRSVKRPDIFTPEIIYNIMGMAIEKYIMGYLVCNGTLADNHTFTDLSNAVRQIEEPGTEFETMMNFMERFQNICSIDGYFRLAPSVGEVPAIIQAGTIVREFVLDRISKSRS